MKNRENEKIRKNDDADEQCFGQLHGMANRDGMRAGPNLRPQWDLTSPLLMSVGAKDGGTLTPARTNSGRRRPHSTREMLFSHPLLHCMLTNSSRARILLASPSQHQVVITCALANQLKLHSTAS